MTNQTPNLAAAPSSSAQGPDSGVRIRCTQLSPKIGAVADNVARIKAEISFAIADKVDLLVLTELATSGYAMTREEGFASAISADGPELRELSDTLRDTGTTVVFGFCEDGGELLYNSAAALVPDAEPVIYRKLHLWNTEKLIFTPGNDRPPIVDTPIGRLGVIICYDLEFPELPRTLALEGAEILAVPANWPFRNRPAGEHPPEVIHAMAAAQASGIIVACCDRAGVERSVSWTEGTAIVGTDGWPVNGVLDANQRLDAVLEVDPKRHVTSERNDLFADRRPEFYGPGLEA